MYVNNNCFQAKLLNLAPGVGSDSEDGICAFLARAMDPPHKLTVLNAVDSLKSLKCLDEKESITPLGIGVMELPIDPRIGRAVWLASMLGCGQAMVQVVKSILLCIIISALVSLLIDNCRWLVQLVLKILF